MDYLAVFRAGLQAAVLFGAGLIIPLIGQAATLFTPVPIVLAALRRGYREAVAALALSALLVSALAGWHAGIVLLLGFGTMAAGIAYGMRKGLKPELSVLMGGLFPVAVALAPLAYYALHASGGLLKPAEEYLRQGIQEAVKVYREAGANDMAAAVNEISDRFIYYCARLLPGIVVTLSLAQAASCFGVARIFFQRNAGPAAPVAAATSSFAAWHAPDGWVWGLIASLGLSAFPHELPRFTGVNLAIVFLLAYSIQGMAVVEFSFRKAGFGALVRSVLHALIIALPTNLFLPPLGVMDIWADFRKVRKPEQGSGETG